MRRFYLKFSFFFIFSGLIEIAKENLEQGIYVTRVHATKRKCRRAKFWDHIHDIVDVHTDTLVSFLYRCIGCKEVIYNGSKDGNTMPFNRHVCYAKETKNNVKNRRNILISNEEKEKVIDAAAKFIAKDLRPYQAIECEGLIELCTASMQFGQRYPKASVADFVHTMPSRHVVVSRICEVATAAKVRITKVMNAAKLQHGLSATTDCWTDNHMRRSYMCITVHATLIEDDQIKNYRFVISMDNITALVKTKAVIVNAILSSFASYGYTAENVKNLVTFVSDRGPNIRYGLQRQGFDLLHCYAHLLNNLTENMLKVPELKTILQNANDLCLYMKRTGLNARLKKTMKTFSRSRWNGACIMFLSVLETDFNLLTEILVEKQRATKDNLVQMVTAVNKDEIRPVYEFLAPIKKWSDMLEGEIEETLHFVWPTFLNLEKHLEDAFELALGDSGLELVELMKTRGRAYMQKNINDFRPKINHKFAAVLHPMMRKLPNIDEHERESVYVQLETKLNQISGGGESIAKETSQAPVVRIKKPSNAMLSAFFEEEMINEDAVDTQNEPTELRRYLDLQMKMNPEDFNLKKWWFGKRHEFPNLTKMYARYLGTPATSAPSERNFSESGLIISTRRNKLLPKNVSNLIVSRNIYKNKM